MNRIAIIGAGFSGLSAAAYLAAAGHKVHVYEKNSTPGGRARQFCTEEGYVFDMGPSWYWMPDVFDRFFNDFGFAVSDFYKLQLLDPAFEIVFADKQKLLIPNDFSSLRNLFESIEPGSGNQLQKFMKGAQMKYEIAMSKFIYLPGLSVHELLNRTVLQGLSFLQLFTSFASHVRKYFSHPMLIALIEFPVLFLGAMPQDTPALYSLMNYAGLKLGTWYPQGGMGEIVKAMTAVCQNHNTSFHFNANVESLIVGHCNVTSVVVNGVHEQFDAVIAAADYEHVESKLLPAAYRNYNDDYWNKKTLAPSCLIYYVGVSKKIISLQHHTLFFEESLHPHAVDIYKTPQWPAKPLFYVCCPSKTDDSIAPVGHENLFFLIPIAPGLDDCQEVREKYFTIMLKRFQEHIGEEVEQHIDFKKSYCVNDFISDYNAFKGNAYGLANTLMQTAFMKPKMRNKKLRNLFYAGQLTVPGPGVPPAIISGKIAATQLMKHLKQAR